MTDSHKAHIALFDSLPREALGGKDSFLVEGEERVWFVAAGLVDLFSVERIAGEVVGERSHIARIDSSEVFFGFPSEGKEFAILAVPGPGTKVVELDFSKLTELVNLSGSASDVSGLVENWITKVTSRVTQVPPEQDLTQLHNKDEVSFDEAEQIAQSQVGVLWLQHVEGASRFLGNENTSINGGSAFPLADSSWVVPEKGTRIVCHETVDIIEKGSTWDSLKGYHQLMYHLFESRREEESRTEYERNKKKRAVRERSFRDGLSSLAQILGEKNRRSTITAADLVDPLFATLTFIGKEQGLVFKPHPDARSNKVIEDPLKGILAASKLRKRSVKLRGNWWEEDCGPFLAFQKDEMNPVALIPTSANSYELIDPVKDTTVPVDREIARTLHVNGIMFYRPFPLKSLSGIDLLRHGLKGAERDLLTVALMGVAGGVIGVIVPYLTGIIFDEIIPGARESELVQVTCVMALTGFVTALFNVTRAIAMLRIESRMGASIQAAVWDRLLALPVPFFRDYTPGDLAMRVHYIEVIRQTLSGVVATSILGGVFSVFYFALLFFYSVKLALIATLLVGVAAATTLVASYFQLQYERVIQKSVVKLSGVIFQFISGIAKLRVTGTERNAFSIWARKYSDQREVEFKAQNLANFLDVFFEVFPLIANITIFYFVAQLVLAGDLSTGYFLAFNAAFISFLTAALQMSDAVSSLVMTLPMYETARPVLESIPEVEPSKSDPGQLSGKIELSHIAFRYSEDGPLILRDISLEINPGEFIAFVGPSGSGKSTIFRLLLGFETPESGTIYYDGQDLAGLDITAVRQKIGVVLQNGKLLPGDIFSNIVGSSSVLTLDDAWEAARMAGFDEDIKVMPMGMHTVVSEGGGTLSGGQRQRLMIARAIVTRPKMMFMDEATSALDNKTQDIVSQSLERMKSTRIVIAHRLSTVKNADRIIVVEGGVIQEQGTYEELMALDGKFATLAKRQLA